MRGAPGAFGCCAGLNTSDRRPGAIGAFPGPIGLPVRACRSSAIVLQPLELHLKLLILVLQLLDGTGELAQCAFHAVEPNRKISISSPSPRRRLARLRLAAVKEIVQWVSGPTLLRQRGTGQKQSGNCGKRRSSV